MSIKHWPHVFETGSQVAGSVPDTTGTLLQSASVVHCTHPPPVVLEHTNPVGQFAAVVHGVAQAPATHTCGPAHPPAALHCTHAPATPHIWLAQSDPTRHCTQRPSGVACRPPGQLTAPDAALGRITISTTTSASTATNVTAAIRSEVRSSGARGAGRAVGGGGGAGRGATPPVVNEDPVRAA